jgi:hypothetical protein
MIGINITATALALCAAQLCYALPTRPSGGSDVMSYACVERPYAQSPKSLFSQLSGDERGYEGDWEHNSPSQSQSQLQSQSQQSSVDSQFRCFSWPSLERNNKGAESNANEDEMAHGGDGSTASSLCKVVSDSPPAGSPSRADRDASAAGTRGAMGPHVDPAKSFLEITSSTDSDFVRPGKPRLLRHTVLQTGQNAEWGALKDLRDGSIDLGSPSGQASPASSQLLPASSQE